MFLRSTTGGPGGLASRSSQAPRPSPQAASRGLRFVSAPSIMVVAALVGPAAACGSAQVSVAAEASAHVSRVVFEAPPLEPDDDPGVPPSRNAVWSAGFWNWTGDEYEWVAGEWMAGRPGFLWVPAHWRPQGRGYLFVPGRWRPTDTGPPQGE